jgi:phage baseplate assembly protein W
MRNMAGIDVVTSRSRQYKDLSLTMGLNPVTNDVIALTGADAVRRSIRNLLSIMPGEVPFLPNFGCSLRALLFEPIDAITTAQIEQEIRATIDAYEPRVTIHTLVVTPSVDELKYQVDVTFLLVNLPEPITLTLFLTRLR